VGLFVIAFGCHLAGTLYLHSGSTLQDLEEDEREYYDWAGKLLEGSSEFSTRRPILHIAIVAGLRFGTGDQLMGIRLGLLILFSLTSPLIAGIVYRLTTHGKSALLAGLGVAVWPLFVRFSGTLYSETTATPLFLLFLILLPRVQNYGERFRIGSWYLAGIILGLATLSRAMYMLFLPFLGLILVVESGLNRRTILAGVVVGIGWASICIPWSRFMSKQSDHFILVSSGGGETLAGTYNPKLIEQGIQHETLPYGRVRWTGPGKWLLDINTGYLKPEEYNLPLAQKDAMLRERATAWMREHPREVVYLTTMKILLLWGLLPHLENGETLLLGNLPILLVLTLSLLAMIRLWSYKRILVRLWIQVLFVTLVAVAAWGSWRYRQPADATLIALVSLGLFHREVRDRLGSAASERT
jgi:hypothetical protein